MVSDRACEGASWVMKCFSPRKTSSKNEPREWPKSRNNFFSTFGLRNKRPYFLGFNFPAFHDFFFLVSISLSSPTFGICCGCSLMRQYYLSVWIGDGKLFISWKPFFPATWAQPIFKINLFKWKTLKVIAPPDIVVIERPPRRRWNFNQCRF